MRRDALNAEIKEEENDKKTFVSFIIRFDGKGCRVFTVDALVQLFRLTVEIERIILTLENGISLKTNRMFGTAFEIRLDHSNPDTSYHLATSDKNDWVDAAFSAMQDIISN